MHGRNRLIAWRPSAALPRHRYDLLFSRQSCERFIGCGKCAYVFHQSLGGCAQSAFPRMTIHAIAHLTDNERLDWLRLIRSQNVGPRGIMAQTPQAAIFDAESDV